MKLSLQPGKHSLSERGDDLYETPPEATRALVAHEPLHGRIWEPACGRGAISEVLRAKGCDVVSTDLVERGYGQGGVDFLMERNAPANVQIILTNPPFKLADQFVRHALTLAPRAIMLLRWAYAEGEKKSDLIDEHLSHVWLGIERLPMMHRDGWDGMKTKAGVAPFAWFVFDQQKRIPTGFIVRRISWR